MFYISKGTVFFTYLYMQDGLGIDPVSMVSIWSFNILGLVVSELGVKTLLLKGASPRTLVKLGFFLLLFIQGVGTGALFVPLSSLSAKEKQKNRSRMARILFHWTSVRLLRRS